MKLDLSVESMQDAVLGRAALDGLLSAWVKIAGNRTAVEVPAQETVEEKIIRELQQASPRAAVVATPAPVEESPAAPVVEQTSQQPADDAAGADEPVAASRFTKAQIKAAAEKNPSLASLVSKKGRKSAAQQAEIDRLTAETLGVADAPAEEPVGNALTGATAEELAAILGRKTTVVHAEPGVEVRQIAPPAVEPPAPPPPVQQLAAEGNSPIAGDSSLAELLASRQKAAPAAPVGTPAPTPPLADPATSEPAKKTVEEMNHEELLQAIRDYSDQGAGLFWFRAVVERSKAGDQSKMSDDYMRQVLSNPDAFYPNAV